MPSDTFLPSTSIGPRSQMKGDKMRMAECLRLAATLALVAALVLQTPSARAGPGEDVKILNRDASYEREVVGGERATAGWFAVNMNNITSYNVRLGLADDYGTWRLSLEPSTFALSPNSAQEFQLVFDSRRSNLGETKTVVVRINVTEITTSTTPASFELSRSVTFTVVAQPTQEVHGLDLLGYHLSLPEPLDNRWGRFAILVLIWFVVGALATFAIIPFLRKLAKRTKTKYDDIVLDIISIPVLAIIVLWGVIDSLAQLELRADVISWLVRARDLVIILILCYVGYKIFKGVLISWLKEVAERTESRVDDVLVPVFDNIGTVVIVVIACIFVLNYLGINVTVFLAGMGVAGLVIAFAAQDTLSNFFAGVHLLLDRPFSVGETIVLENGDYCEVKHIGMRSTQLYNLFTVDTISIPNSKIANMQIINVCRPTRMEKAVVELSVAYDSDLDKVEKIIDEVVSSHPNVVKDEKHRHIIRLTEFGDSGIKYKVWFVVDDFQNRWRVSHELRKEVFKRFRREGVEVPFPQRVVRVRRD